ncbi:MAG: NAD(P)-dependent oxidoreductase [Deltaproteobacteria bacterium]|nr:NAD(P)-dependent oxidoreductase [Deltaproteobacteria bacterium]
MESKERILIVGCGYVGTALAERLSNDGYMVWGAKRHVETLPSFVQPVQADITQPNSLQTLPDVDVIVYAVSAGGFDEERYRRAYAEGVRNILDVYEQRDTPPRRLFFVSSTSVYAQTDGEWVDEASPTQPTHFSGQYVRQGETLCLASSIPATVVRLGGIYGPERTRLLNNVRQGKATLHPGKTHYTNRIHRADCAGMLHHLIQIETPKDCYLGVDCAPASKREVYGWMAEQMGAPVPLESDTQSTSRRAQSNKRCRNTRLLDEGYVFSYPTYKEGYTEMINALGWGKGRNE